jgi:formylglycine-generating enzyme required for sulfatase activity
MAGSYAVSYSANGAAGGSAPVSQTKTHGVSLTLRTNSGGLFRTGYTFTGWNTLPDGNGADYAEGGTYAANAAVTLYAKWARLEGTYMVIDLSSGSASTHYPVMYLSDVPAGGWTDTYKTTKLVLRRVSEGEFDMGSPTAEQGRKSEERQWRVLLSRAFFIGVFEVTQRQWELVMGNRPSYYGNAAYYAARPVEQVSYYDIREQPSNEAISPHWPVSGQVHASSFVGRLRARTGESAFDLPTEAQWEYACRAGMSTALNSGRNLTSTDSCTNMSVVGRYKYNGGSGSTQNGSTSVATAKAGSYQANAWGLYDMHGNVWELCLDGYGAYSASAVDPAGVAEWTECAERGGCFANGAAGCRSAMRNHALPSDRKNGVGFRISRTLPAIEVEVRFDPQGGSAPVPASLPAVYGSPYGALPAIARPGYSFKGWWMRASGGGSNVTATTRVMGTSNHWLYAWWVTNTPPVIASRSPASSPLAVTELSSLTFSVSANDSADTDVATRGMSNIVWSVDGVKVMETMAASPSSVSSAFTYKPTADTVVGQASRDVTLCAAAFDRHGGVTEVVWAVRVDNLRAAQTVAFKALAPKVLGDADFAAGGVASSGLPVQYESSNGGVATVSGGVIQIVGAGVTVITASQPGDLDFKAATPVRQTLTVKVRLTAEVPEGGGSVAGGGTYQPGAKATLIAKPLPGYSFLSWEDGSQQLSRSVVIPNANMTVLASFGLTAGLAAPVIRKPLAQTATVGVAFALPLTVDSECLPTVTVTGLPSGLKYVAGSLRIAGLPTKAGTFTVTVAASNPKGKAVPQEFAITVAALPAWAQGSFGGYAWADGLDSGSASMSVTAFGGVSGKLTLRGTNFTFSALSFASRDEGGVFWLTTTAKVAKAAFPLTLAVYAPESAGAAPATLGKSDGALGTLGEESGTVTLYRSVWKDAGMAAVATNYTGYYTATLPGGEGYGSGYLAFTVDKSGGVKTVGKLADGTAVSLGGTLILDESGRVWTVLYAAPAAYLGGGLFGIAEFVKPEQGPVTVRVLNGQALLWQNLNPLSTGDYDAGGFSRDLGLQGGVYNTLINLRSYYENGLSVGGVNLPSLTAVTKFTDVNELGTGKITWAETNLIAAADGASPNGLALAITPATGTGTGLLAPRADTPVRNAETGEYDYTADTTGDGVANTSGLTLTFTRATGLFKGSFKTWYDYASAQDYTLERVTLMHAQKSILYEGALTPVRESGDADGRGFFLWADTSAYDTGKVDKYGEPVMKAYSFNGSYDFLLLGN